jgi:hypothetical protein
MGLNEIWEETKSIDCNQIKTSLNQDELKWIQQLIELIVEFNSEKPDEWDVK